MKISSFSSGMSIGYFVTDEKTILVDTGCVTDAEDFLAKCAEAGVAAADIDLIVISHEHADHFLQLDVVKKLCGAKVLAHREALHSISNGLEPQVTPRHGGAAPGSGGEPKPDLGPIAKVTPDILIGDEDYDLSPWGINAKLIHTPGHSRGGISFVSEDFAIIGDLVMPLETEPFFQTAVFADDEPGLKNSIQRLLAAGCATYYSGHAAPCPAETLRTVYEAEWAKYGI